MAFLEVNHVEVVGMAAAVPSINEENVNIYKKWGGGTITSLPQQA